MIWEIDAVHSRVGFSVRHLMVSNVRGHFHVVRGQLDIDEQNPANSWVEAEVDAASIETQNEQRDMHLRTGDFFETEKYPTITFKSTKVEHVGDQDYQVMGDLTMHGVTRPVTFHAQYSGQSNIVGVGPRAGLEARTKINRRDFNLSYGTLVEAGNIALGEIVTIEIDLEATPKVEKAQEAGATAG
jgi:polyisoprenoid-binding protein YceI